MATSPILEAFVKNWWVLLIRGIFALLFAIMAFKHAFALAKAQMEAENKQS